MLQPGDVLDVPALGFRVEVRRNGPEVMEVDLVGRRAKKLPVRLTATGSTVKAKVKLR